MREPSLADLESLLSYNPVTGEFCWLVPRSAMKAGARAGKITAAGYRVITCQRRSLFAHRLAFLFMEGRWPLLDVDHINGVRDDNRWANLRECTRQQNQWNQGSRTDLPLGVTLHRATGRYQAQFKIGRTNHYLGLYETPEQASAVYLAAVSEHRGPYMRGAA